MQQVAIGFSVLKASKLLMYDFDYNVMKTSYYCLCHSSDSFLLQHLITFVFLLYVLWRFLAGLSNVHVG